VDAAAGVGHVRAENATDSVSLTTSACEIIFDAALVTARPKTNKYN
jgi:hypothetical protein